MHIRCLEVEAQENVYGDAVRTVLSARRFTHVPCGARRGGVVSRLRAAVSAAPTLGEDLGTN